MQLNSNWGVSTMAPLNSGETWFKNRSWAKSFPLPFSSKFEWRPKFRQEIWWEFFTQSRLPLNSRKFPNPWKISFWNLDVPLPQKEIFQGFQSIRACRSPSWGLGLKTISVGSLEQKTGEDLCFLWNLAFGGIIPSKMLAAAGLHHSSRRKCQNWVESCLVSYSFLVSKGQDPKMKPKRQILTRILSFLAEFKDASQNGGGPKVWKIQVRTFLVRKMHLDMAWRNSLQSSPSSVFPHTTGIYRGFWGQKENCPQPRDWVLRGVGELLSKIQNGPQIAGISLLSGGLGAVYVLAAQVPPGEGLCQKFS